MLDLFFPNSYRENFGFSWCKTKKKILYIESVEEFRQQLLPNIKQKLGLKISTHALKTIREALHVRKRTRNKKATFFHVKGTLLCI
jgi:ribosomal protein L28